MNTFLILIVFLVLLGGLVSFALLVQRPARRMVDGFGVTEEGAGGMAGLGRTARLALRRLEEKRREKAFSFNQFPIPVLAGCTIPVAAMLFYLARGYQCLGEVFAPGAVGVMFVAMQVVAPVLGAVVCLVYHLKCEGRLLYLYLMGMNVIFVAVGLLGLVWA